ncbi:YhcH/YjgK/YiaL family protein [Vibrio nigripulchritudo]|uniref:YhcH/YjgK/YiaL family protein n=1 Tax=Vibrio nigripulchritudo TaxID=28173 RepID=UPI0005704EBC|nr:YhcH/YjgK/YiaL family protein [Vibrio nigripulchritudo]
MLVGSTSPTTVTPSYPEVVQTVLKRLSELDLDALPSGHHKLPGFNPDQVWCTVLEYEKVPLDSLLPEVHRHHSDLQILVTGSETMAWAIDSGQHTPAEPYLETRDLQFYEPEGLALNFLQATPNRFYLFTPNVVHITNIQNHDAAPVKKLVVKIHNELLDLRS